jgi:hypothetical protein
MLESSTAEMLKNNIKGALNLDGNELMDDVEEKEYQFVKPDRTK